MRSNLNTILLAATLGLLGWIGLTTHETSKAVATLATVQQASDRDLLDLRARVAAVEIDIATLKARIDRP